MPIINIDMIAGRSLEEKRALVKNVTRAVCDSIKTSPDRVKIKLNELSTENYAISGKLVIDQNQ
jgi:4-oxalocrotonate tautomerase